MILFRFVRCTFSPPRFVCDRGKMLLQHDMQHSNSALLFCCCDIYGNVGCAVFQQCHGNQPHQYFHNIRVSLCCSIYLQHRDHIVTIMFAFKESKVKMKTVFFVGTVKTIYSSGHIADLKLPCRNKITYISLLEPQKLSYI